ncbi:MAG: hypothetical protein FWC03_02845 [Treponema sp.]|nr:hypothetical protein [Treponema sp.]
MNTELSMEKTAFKHEQLIGTKWTSWRKSFGDRFTVEFVDQRNCIFTSQPKKYPLTYTVTGGQIFISKIDGPFELRGNVLYNNNLPTFEKTA